MAAIDVGGFESNQIFEDRIQAAVGPQQTVAIHEAFEQVRAMGIHTHKTFHSTYF